MFGFWKLALYWSLVFGIWTFCAYSLASDPAPLIHAHAHNDYLHQHPLFDALDQGFCSFEADVHLIDGQFLVAHDKSQVSPDKTLQSLYLEPLRERVKKNGGRVYAGGSECTLLIDLKSDWHTAYPALRDVLKGYDDILSVFRDGKKQTNAVTAIISGNRSLAMFSGEATRYAAYDGQLSDLDSTEPSDLIPWISINWRENLRWRVPEGMTAEDKEKLTDIVRKAHARGRKVRFWGAPDNSVFWNAMLDNGVDLINTDDLPGLRRFFEEEQKPKGK